jgi:protoheme ferro-lyase
MGSIIPLGVSLSTGDTSSLPHDKPGQGYHRVKEVSPVEMYVYWTALVAGSLLAGACLVWLLALKRGRQPLVVLAGLIATIAAGYGMAELVTRYGTPEAIVTLSLITLGCIGGGYGIASSLLANLARRGRRRDLGFADEEQARADAAVLIVACVEPKTYDPGAVALELDHYEDAGIQEATVGMTPFMYAAQKARYRAAGGESPSLSQATATVVRLEQLLDRDRYGWVDLVTCQPKDALDVAISRMVRRGFKRIIVGAISVAESYELDRAKIAVDALRPEAHGISVTYATTLWASDDITEMVAERIWTSAATDVDATGIALIMHGQPEAYQQTHAQFDAQENAFCNRIRMLLVDKGVRESNIRLCWMDWRPPDVTETVRHLAALGCERILVVPACYTFDSITTLLDLPMAVRQARVEDHVYVTILTAWGEDPLVAQALADMVQEAAAELE